MSRHDDLVDLARRHAALERELDVSGGADAAIDAVLATLDDDPLYELFPAGVSFRGRAEARRYYQHFFTTFRPSVVGGEFIAEYVGDDGVTLEYVIAVRTASGAVDRHRIISVLTFSDRLLSGERVYGSDEFLAVLFGPMFRVESQP
jgi:hypothetical protein